MHPALLALETHFSPSTLSQITHELLTQHRIELWLKRDDCLHSIISGNKWRKLKYHLNHALAVKATTLISMGGAYSNHLHALAYLGQRLHVKTVAYIRGEQPARLTPTLRDVLDWGMTLHFISRTDFRLLRYATPTELFMPLQATDYWLPEGGAHALALLGVGELVTEITEDFDVLCAPCGTGTTLAGLIAAVPAPCQLLGFAAVRHGQFLTRDITKLLPHTYTHWSVNTAYDFGGFAKTSPALLHFIADFERQHAIPLEPVYTGKMLYGVFDLIRQGYFAPGTKIIALHTGGLQGNRGFTRD